MTETPDRPMPREIPERAERVLRRACEAKIGLATAESCTGGLLAALLTDIEGVSHVFDRGFVAYSDKAKCDLLGLEREEVRQCGAVSTEVALKMAEGALKRSEADIAVSITGFAGPAGEENEEGLVYLACARRSAETVCREKHYGAIGRDGVRHAALDTALALFEEALEE